MKKYNTYKLTKNNRDNIVGIICTNVYSVLKNIDDDTEYILQELFFISRAGEYDTFVKATHSRGNSLNLCFVLN